MHIALAGLGRNAVQFLLFADHAQGQGVQDLGLASGEERGTVGAGQHAHFAGDGPHFGGEAAVDADLVLGDEAAHGLFLDGVEHVADDGGVIREPLGQSFLHFGFQRGDLGFPLLLRGALVAALAHEDGELIAGQLTHGGFQLFRRSGLDEFDLRGGQAHFQSLGPEFLDEGHYALDLLVGGHDAFQDDRFRDLPGARFHHHHGVGGAGHGNVHLGELFLLHGGVEDILAVDQAYGDASDGTVERDLGNVQRAGGGDHGHHVRGVILIHGEDGVDHLHVVAEALGEKGAQRTVDEAGAQNGLFRRTAFAFDETAGDLAHGVHFFFEFDLQREEIDALPGLVADGHCGQDLSIAVAGEDGAAGLFGHAAGLESQRTSRDLDAFA